MLDASTNILSDRQRDLLKILLKNKAGLSIDEVAERLGVTRPAARQHLVRLERRGYVSRGEPVQTGGRPGQLYCLGDKGHELFPKQYAWLSEEHIAGLKNELGSQGLREHMRRQGAQVAESASEQVPATTLGERVRETAKLMTDLAYQARATFTGKEAPGSPPVIEASNCVFHALATQFPEICEFDLGLLAGLTGAEITHEQCIVRGGGCCRFRLTPITRTTA